MKIFGEAGFGHGPGCLILVVVIGVIIAIQIPYLGRRGENSYLASTEQGITALAGALEAHFEENGSYPKARTVQELARELSVSETGTGDLKYECWSDSSEDAECMEYALGGPGLDHLWGRASLRDYGPAAGPLSPGADIVLRNGDFIQKPEPWDLSWRTGSGLFPLLSLIGGGLIVIWLLKELFGD
jgi:hypothetical protein